ncbi:hypothetical protein L1987_78539 [Smallanthus sonchifolius]|uniref:Uncharacterized protein n=1 Tax=Smallanthus sonchifolius TaxID=185202 RepID=A0ACB8ZC13_9ASTR|nr:hypothetical protein L1987_78539 [Smallanthus sonchifolius]
MLEEAHLVGQAQLVGQVAVSTVGRPETAKLVTGKTNVIAVVKGGTLKETAKKAPKSLTTQGHLFGRHQNWSPSYSRSCNYRRLKSPRDSRSPSGRPEARGSPPPLKGKNRNPTPNEDRASPSPDRVNSDYSMSPQRAKSQSPAEANGCSCEL